MENLGADVHIGRYDSYYADGKFQTSASITRPNSMLKPFHRWQRADSPP